MATINGRCFGAGRLFNTTPCKCKCGWLFGEYRNSSEFRLYVEESCVNYTYIIHYQHALPAALDNIILIFMGIGVPRIITRNRWQYVGRVCLQTSFGAQKSIVYDGALYNFAEKYVSAHPLPGPTAVRIPSMLRCGGGVDGTVGCWHARTLAGGSRCALCMCFV